MMHAAIHDALNEDERRQPYALTPSARGVPPEAAVAAAAHDAHAVFPQLPSNLA
jgi:hypothetical protein